MVGHGVSFLRFPNSRKDITWPTYFYRKNFTLALKLEGISVSSPTVQNILIKHGMGSKYERWLKLEELAAEQAIELTPEQVALIEKANPCFRERHVESSRPGFRHND